MKFKSDCTSMNRANDLRYISVSFTDEQISILDKLRAEKNLSRSALILQSLRLYQAINDDLSGGGRMVWPDTPDGCIVDKSFSEYAEEISDA